nr:FkbM family methyltransferase [Paludisphaera mucosa]
MYYGWHENDEIDYTLKYLDPALPTVEFGASIGALSCITNRHLQRPTEHVVVEANPVVVPTLLKNRELNGCRFQIISAAVGAENALIEFQIDDHLESRISSGGDSRVTVAAIGLKDILKHRGFQTINLQIDVEGAEIALVDDELETLRAHVKHIVMETHARFLTGDGTEKMLEKLERAGFECLVAATPSSPVVVFRNRALDGPTRAE